MVERSTINLLKNNRPIYPVETHSSEPFWGASGGNGFRQWYWYILLLLVLSSLWFQKMALILLLMVLSFNMVSENCTDIFIIGPKFNMVSENVTDIIIIIGLLSINMGS